MSSSHPGSAPGIFEGRVLNLLLRIQPVHLEACFNRDSILDTALKEVYSNANDIPGSYLSSRVLMTGVGVVKLSDTAFGV